MYPDLFRVGPFTLHAYGSALALSFLLGLLLARYRAKRRGVDEGAIMDLFQLIVLSSIVGARIFFVVFHLDAFAGRWWHILFLWEGGLTLYGGLLLAMLVSALYMRAKKLSFLSVADVLAPSLALGILITRVGCFLNGCCFGLPTNSPLGVCFPANSEAGRTAVQLAHDHAGSGVPPIHPSQLYSSLGGGLILVLLLLLDRRERPPGFTFANFLLLYGVHRLIIDEFRYYEEVMRVLGLSVNQWLSLGLIACGLLLHRSIRAHRRAATP